MRRYFLAPRCVISFLAFFIAVQVANVGWAGEFDPDQIKAALQTTSDEEGGFIDNAVALVNAGTLPREMFLSTFIWARRKPRHKFQYFKQGLITRAAEAGISL